MVTTESRIWNDSGVKPAVGDEVYVGQERPIAEYDNWAMWAVTKDIDTIASILGPLEGVDSLSKFTFDTAANRPGDANIDSTDDGWVYFEIDTGKVYGASGGTWTTFDELDADAVDSNELAPDAVGSGHIQTDAVALDEIDASIAPTWTSKHEFSDIVVQDTHSVQVGETSSETITETTSPTSWNFSGSYARDIHDITRLTISNGTTSSVTEDVTVELYDGTDTTGTLIASHTKSVTVGAGSTATTSFISKDYQLDGGTYHIEVTTSGTTLSVDQAEEDVRGATHTVAETAAGELIVDNQDGRVLTLDPVDEFLKHNGYLDVAGEDANNRAIIGPQGYEIRGEYTGDNNAGFSQSTWASQHAIIDRENNRSQSAFSVRHDGEDFASSTELFRVQENGLVYADSMEIRADSYNGPNGGEVLLRNTARILDGGSDAKPSLLFENSQEGYVSSIYADAGEFRIRSSNADRYKFGATSAERYLALNTPNGLGRYRSVDFTLDSTDSTTWVAVDAWNRRSGILAIARHAAGGPKQTFAISAAGDFTNQSQTSTLGSGIVELSSHTKNGWSFEVRLNDSTLEVRANATGHEGKTGTITKLTGS